MSTASKRITLVPLATADPAVRLKVRELRNEPNTRKWMYTDHEISEAEHQDWLARVDTDDRQQVFVVLDEDRTPLGVVSLNAIDRRHHRADWAFYLTQAARGGLGSALEFAFLDFAFNRFGLEKLNCEVIEGNDAVVKLHGKFLFEEEGFRRSNLLKDGRRLGVHFLGLTREAWLAGRAQVAERYRGVFERFRITIDATRP